MIIILVIPILFILWTILKISSIHSRLEEKEQEKIEQKLKN